MSSIRKVGLALAALGYAARRAAAVDVGTCAALLEAVSSAADTATSISLTTSFACSQTVSISDDQDITIDGADNTITISNSFTSSVSTGSSLFSNLGSLSITNLIVTESGDDLDTAGVRAIHNEGALTISSCEFQGLNVRTEISDRMAQGGVIYTNTDANSITISSSTFKSNLASQYGGAICAAGTDILDISDSVFSQNEVDSDGDETSGRGGDVYAEVGVQLTVKTSNFSGSSATYAGAGIWCCGASIRNCFFTNLETSSTSGNYGAVTSGLPDTDECSSDLEVDGCEFSGCQAYAFGGKGGSLSIFDTTASVSDTIFENSQGTAMLFESSTGDHFLDLNSVQFNKNSDPSTEYANGDDEQGAALVITSTGSSGNSGAGLKDIFCFSNEPYWCEILYNGTDVSYTGDQKCNVCTMDGTKQDTDGGAADDDADASTERSVDSDSSGNQSVIIGLSIALGVTLAVIAGLAAYKFRVKKNARRLMEDMGDGDL